MFFAASTAPVAHADDAKTILLEAVKNGTASGELTGDQADVWMAKTRSREPIKVIAKVVEQLKQPGCVRLAVQMNQDGVPKQTGGSGPLEVGWGMNICDDGSPPADVSAFTASQQGTVKINKVTAP